MDELAVKVDNTEEGLQGLLGGGNLPLFDDSILLRVGTDLSGAHNQAKVLNFWSFEEALLGFQAEVMIT